MTAASALVLLALAATPAPRERPEWAPYFAAEDVTGTVVVVDERPGGGQFVWGAERAGKRFIPASTFKIPHLLFALDAGIVRDEFQVFPWDGQKREIEAWNRDADLRASMRHSIVPIYQYFARELGIARERAYLEKIRYGNADPTDALETFWLSGPLAISAYEQIDFLRRLYRNELPFKVEHQRLVKDILIVEAGRQWILRAKTGWQARLEPNIGWWVGWVEHPEGPVFFALNIDLPRKGQDTPKREAIARRILASIGALPPTAAPPP